MTYSKFFRTIIDGLVREWHSGGRVGLPGALGELTAAVERLALYAFTGETKVIGAKVMKTIGAFGSIARHAWPFINPKYLSGTESGGYYNVQHWPKGGNGEDEEDERPHLLQLASLFRHYGPDVRDGLLHHLWIKDFGGQFCTSASEIKRHVFEVIVTMMIPQTVEFLRHQWLRRLALPGRDQWSGEDINRRLVAINKWAKEDHPLSYE